MGTARVPVGPLRMMRSSRTSTPTCQRTTEPYQTAPAPNAATRSPTIQRPALNVGIVERNAMHPTTIAYHAPTREVRLLKDSVVIWVQGARTSDACDCRRPSLPCLTQLTPQLVTLSLGRAAPHANVLGPGQGVVEALLSNRAASAHLASPSGHGVVTPSREEEVQSSARGLRHPRRRSSSIRQRTSSWAGGLTVLSGAGRSAQRPGRRPAWPTPRRW
jgi:hypothetical protein